MTQEQRIDKTIEIAARIYGDILDNLSNAEKYDGNLYFAEAGTISVHIAEAIISEAEKEDAK